MKNIWFFLSLLPGFYSLQETDVGYNVVTNLKYTLVETAPNGGKKYYITSPASRFNDPPILVTLLGERYEMGFDEGYLTATETVENFNTLLKSILGDKWYEPAQQAAMAEFLDIQWKVLGKQCPTEYKEELKGVTDGGKAKKVKDDVGKIMQRAIVLGNMPGDSDDVKRLIQNEIQNNLLTKRELDVMHYFLDRVNEYKWSPGPHCSMFAVWGDRTDGELYSGRNLDWNKDTGVAKHKLVTVYRPNGANAHATFGFASLHGALAGMSAKGMSVHEANLETVKDTFNGFPWLLRLRYVMEKAATISEAVDIWTHTNNTVGFNFMVTSAEEQNAVVFETKGGYTAYFESMDPREKNGRVHSESPFLTNGTLIGHPRPNALYRANHGYDPQIVASFNWNHTHAYNNSIYRYNLFPTMLDQYESQNTKIKFDEATRIGAVVAQKSEADYYHCLGNPYDGSDVMSVIYEPGAQSARVSWENGHKTTWTPAGCTSYLQIDFKPLFEGKDPS